MVLVAVILLLLPVTRGVYDFRTDQREDTFNLATAVGETAANVTLLKAIYDNDTSTIGYTSNISEVPTFVSYNATTRQVWTSGLTANETRALAVTYDIDALGGNQAVGTLMNYVPLIWILTIVGLPIAAIIVLFR